MCDGYYFPISFATTKDNFARDAKMCERSCKSPARLFFHENPGQAPEDMEDARGKRYTDLKVAFSHQQQYDEACTCKAQPWDEAALARHRQFAEAAERKKGGKRDNNRPSKLEQVSVVRERTAHPAGHDGFELQQALLPPALMAVSAKRRQSLAPAHRLINSRLLSPRGIALYQTPISSARQPQQCRPGIVVDNSASSIVDAAQNGRRSPAATAEGAAQPSRRGPPQAKSQAKAQAKAASGQSASNGASSGAVAATPSGKNLADGAETQVR